MPKLKSSPSKSLKKVDAPGIFIDLECETKHFLQNLPAWDAECALIEQGINRCEAAIRKEISLSGSDLAKEYNSVHTKTNRLSKAIEATHKKLNKVEAEFEKKILTPEADGEFAGQPQNVLEEIATNKQKIQELSATNKNLMDPLLQKTLSYTSRLALLENSINEKCLPDDLEDAAKASGKLSDRLEAICAATAGLSRPEARSSSDMQSFEGPFLQLYAAHRRQGELLNQSQKNLGITLKAAITEPSGSSSTTPKAATLSS